MNLPVTASPGKDFFFNFFAPSHSGAQDVKDLLCFQVGHRLGADHSPIRNDADPTDGKTALQSLDYRNERLHIRRVPRPHLAADRSAVIVQDNPYHHLK